MCNATNCNHDPLDDSLDGFLGDFGLEAPTGKLVLPANDEPSIADALHYDVCKACKGSKVFRSYTGRVVGPCFKCKGEGKIGYKTSAATREGNRASAAKRKQDKVGAWITAHPEEYAWLIVAVKRGFRVAQNLADDLQRFGDLTEGKVALIQRFMAEDKERAEQRENAKLNAKIVDVSKIEEAFAIAMGNQVKKPKLGLDAYRFSAVTEGKNAGSIYVKEIETDEYLGKITGGKFFRVRACTDEMETRIIAAAADPRAAAIAYGRREGACSVCGLTLTNHESIDLGIGPICAGKWGF